MWLRALRVSRRTFRRTAIVVLGSTVVLFGLLLIVLPGPALIVIPAGLAILGLEFAWARRWMLRLEARVKQTYSRLSSFRGLERTRGFQRPREPERQAWREPWRSY